MSEWTVDRAAGVLLEAEAAGTDRPPITDEWPGLDLATAALDLGLEACLLELNGQVVDSATGAAVQGHPAEALALAANDLGRRGLAIEPGWIVLTGGMTDAVAVPAGAVLAAHFTHLGSLFLP